jgi:hypothetical protein
MSFLFTLFLTSFVQQRYRYKQSLFRSPSDAKSAMRNEPLVDDHRDGEWWFTRSPAAPRSGALCRALTPRHKFRDPPRDAVQESPAHSPPPKQEGEGMTSATLQ